MKLFSRISRGFFYAVTSSFLWACSIVNSRYLLSHGEEPLNLTVWIGLAMVIPWAFLFRRHVTAYKALSPKFKLYLVGIGIASSIGINYLQALALANTSAVNFSFLYRTIVVFTIVFAYLFFKEAITMKKWFLTLLILTGSYLLTTGGRIIALTTGDLYTLLMAASAAFVANILIKHTVSRMHPDLSGSVISLVSAASLLLFGCLSGRLALPVNMFMICIGAAFSFTLTMARNRAYTFATASFVTMIFSLTPVFVALLSYPLLGERLEPMELVGGAIIVGSTFLVEKFKI